MFEVVGQDIISGNMGFIGTDSDRLYRMGTAEKTEDVTVTGNPAVLDNATGKPFKDLHIYGRSEQVTTTGAQLLDLSDLIGKTETKNGATYKINEDQSVTVSGTPTEYTPFPLKRMSLKAGSYYFKSNSNSNKAFIQLLGTKVDMNNGFTLDEDSDMIDAYMVFNVAPNNTESFDTTFVTMLNAGDTALPWEPYTGGKPSPSPDYPQEIVNAGGDGSLNVMVRGKNIFPGPEQPKTVEKNGLTFSYKDGMYTLVGTSNTDTWFNIYPNIRNSTSTTDIGGIIHSIGKVAVVNGMKNKLYTINFRDVNTKDKTENVTFSDNKKHLSFDTDGVFAYVRPGTYSETFTLMIVDENQAEDYEPYHEPQSMSVTTPNGLPGIPVTSGGNYTDENGQQWICDEVEFGRGVYVQRVKVKELSPDDRWTYRKLASGNNNYQARIYGEDVAKNYFPSICNILPFKNVRWDDNIQNLPKIYAINQEITASFPPNSEYSSLEAFKQLLTNVKSVIYYALATPIETPLTASEIAAYKSLRTYRGTTIVEARDKAGISATYKCNTKAAEKEVNILHADLMAEMEELDENSEIV